MPHRPDDIPEANPRLDDRVPGFLVHAVAQLTDSEKVSSPAGAQTSSAEPSLRSLSRREFGRVLDALPEGAGLRLGRRITEPNLALIGSMLTASRTLSDAYEHFEWIAARMGLGSDGRLEVAGDEARYRLLGSDLGHTWDDLRVSLAFHSVRRFEQSALRSETDSTGIRAHFARPEPTNMADYLDCFGEAVVFGSAWTGLRFHASLLHLPRPGVDGSLARELRQIASQRLRQSAQTEGAWTARVQAALRELGSLAQVDLTRVATLWGVSLRTLRRRLGEEGTSLSQLLDGVRLERARAHLGAASSATIAEVAGLLGYSDETSFRRAFKRWAGESPVAYRDRHSADPDAEH